MPSPKPMPAKLRLIGGRGPGRDSGGRKVEAPPAFTRYAPERPDDLSAEAAKHWDEIVPELARLELLTPSHAGGLEIMCETWSRWREAQELVREEGVLGENSQGRVRHPAVAVVEAASREYRAWAGEFGLTLATEGRLNLKEAQRGDENPFAQRSAPQS